MTRGRKPLQPNINTTEVNEDLVRSDLERIDQLPALELSIQENALALAKELSYEGALTVESLEEEIKFYQRRSVEAVLELGKRLKMLKVVAGHGGFIESLDRLGIEQSMARRFISAMEKFSNRASTHVLGLPGLNQTKLLELLVLDDGEIESLDQGDTIRGITLDDVDCMSVSELRRALRQEKADKEADVAKAHAKVSGDMAAKDRLIAEGKKRIADLVEEKNKRECMTDGERIADLERQLMEHTLVAAGALIPVRKVVLAARSLDHCPQGLYVAMQGALDRVIAEAMSIATDYGIQLNLGMWPDDDELGDPNEGEVIDTIFPASE
jgi:hypothetical protein